MTMNIGHKAIATPVQSPTLKEIKQEAANAQSEPVGMMATGHTPEETEGLSCKLSADRQAVEGKLHKSNHAIGHAATGSKGGDFVATNLRKSDGTSGGAMVAMRKDTHTSGDAMVAMRKDSHAGGHSAAVGSKGGDFVATNLRKSDGTSGDAMVAMRKDPDAGGSSAVGSKGGDFVATNLRKSDGTSGDAMVAMRKDPHAGGHSAVVGSKGGDFAATTGSAPVGVTASLAKSNVT
jgi:hypothetical protein